MHTRSTQARSQIVATLPVRSLHDGKRRLAERFSAGQRRELIMALCATVVHALRDSEVITTIGLVSGDEAALHYGRLLGLEAIKEEREGLNEALMTAGAWARSHEAGAHLIVLPDLPLLHAADVRSMAAAVGAEPGVVICPDRTRTGTNLLLMQPSEAIPTRFGHNSFERHLAICEELGRRPLIYDSPGTRWDVDTPTDLEELGIEL